MSERNKRGRLISLLAVAWFLFLASLCAANERCKGLLLNAEPFGFGPTAATAQLFSELRPSLSVVGYIGEGHTLGLQENLPYDDLVKLDSAAPEAEVRAELRRLAGRYSHFFTSSDFKYASIAKEEGYKVGIYDPLTWFWNEIPGSAKGVDLYVAQDFVGVKERIEAKRASLPAATRIIPSLSRPLNRPGLKNRKKAALINLGGLSNPFIADDTMFSFASILAQSCHLAVSGPFKQVFVATNTKFARSMPAQMHAGTFSPAIIQSHLEHAQVAFMTSGLGNLFEASSANAPTIWLPPANDSQGQQIQLLKRKDLVDWSVDWHDFTEGGPINYFQPQETVMREIKSRMQALIESPDAQRRLQLVLGEKFAQALERINAANAREAETLKIGRLVELYGQGGLKDLGHIVKTWISQTEASPAFQKTWQVGGGLAINFQSDAPFALTKDDEISLAAHLPGFQDTARSAASSSRIKITHRKTESETLNLTDDGKDILVSAPWGKKLPPDFVHLLYGAARREWIKNDIYPVHGACIGNEKDGYALLVGAPGSGKTSLTLYNAVYKGLKIFSGDKTLIRLSSDGAVEAIAGTRTITVRANDLSRWSSLKKVHEHRFGDRLAFQLADEHYEAKSTIRIKNIFLVGLNDAVQDVSQFSPLSALHTLYPFFLDKQREDTLMGGDDALLSGAVPSETKSRLSQRLLRALQDVPVHKVSASLAGLAEIIHKELRADRSRPKAEPPAVDRARKKILYGVCGIGNGHCGRQLPILQHLLEEGHQVLVFAYGDALRFFQERFPKVTVIEVANPYFVGAPSGLDFEQTAASEKNRMDFNRINSLAMHEAAKKFGRPDLVISDYEMVSAQYAYAKRVPLVTLDQQSKYLVGDFPPDLAGTSYADEVERLSMFFPTALKRIAVSFFTVATGDRAPEHLVDVLPPVIRPEIIAAKGKPKSNAPSVVVYVTSQQLGNQPIDEWIRIIESTMPASANAHVFLPRWLALPANTANVFFYHHGNSKFDELLIASHGVISTAGHTLLSEAMHLEKPVYALPLPLYEQQLNAKVIADGGFGMREESLSESGLSAFLSRLNEYAENIRRDKTLLFKTPGNDLVIHEIDRLLKK